MRLRFLGAAGTVTGSRTLVSYGNKNFLVDCGLFQGPKELRELNWEPNINVYKIDGIILTHAHIDHTGLLPKLYKDGYRNPIYCSKGTRVLCELMLLDSAHLQEEDARFANQSGYSHHAPALPLYTIEDAKAVLELFQVIPSLEWFELSKGIQIRLSRSGHILGSTFVEMQYREVDRHYKMTFSGDLGNGRSHIIRPPLYINETDFLVIEATYGDRLQPRDGLFEKLAQVIVKIANRNGVLIIPAFSVGRTQEILYYLRKLEEQNKIPDIPVFVDGPMANQANAIYMKHKEEQLLDYGPNGIMDPICPKCFEGVTDPRQSQMLNNREGPMIIISASGMLTGGRVMHHLKTRLPNPQNGILFVGYQAENTKGALLRNGIKSIRIHHEEVKVEAEIFEIDGFSAHADYQDTIDWLTHINRKPRKIFINHGAKIACENLKKLIEEKFNIPCVIPKYMEEINLLDDTIQDA